MRLTDFKALTFDCYGTLIDWESGMMDALESLTRRLNAPLPRNAVLEAHARHESAQQAQTPYMRYRELLAIVYKRLAEEWGVAVPWSECVAYGLSVREWPAFPDTAGAPIFVHTTPDKLGEIEKMQLDLSDVVSFHSYEKPEVFEKRVEALGGLQRRQVDVRLHLRLDGNARGRAALDVSFVGRVENRLVLDAPAHDLPLLVSHRREHGDPAIARARQSAGIRRRH